jgi:hypothetical protein
VRAFDAPACVIVKHANPCGVAVAASIGEAYDRAYAVDPTSAFGGIIAFNRPLDAATAAEILKRQFVEGRAGALGRRGGVAGLREEAERARAREPVRWTRRSAGPRIQADSPAACSFRTPTATRSRAPTCAW